MRVGYSFWGFLGAGVTDTPDGGRSHRRTLIDAIGSLGAEVVFLQANRDLEEARCDFRNEYRWDQGFPELDRLFLEWRWPIPRRNTTPCGTPGHTCDLHRQDDLVAHYTLGCGVPTTIWDKDRQLPADHPLRSTPNVTVCDPAVVPSPGGRSLLFPIADALLDRLDGAELARQPRDIPLVYIGNQYDRDQAFDRYFAPAAQQLRHVVAGKWTNTVAWPGVVFLGRIPFPQVDRLYRRSLATVLLLPERYAAAGHMTQRIFEALLAGCVPLIPRATLAWENFAPPEAAVDSANEVVRVVEHLAKVAGSPWHEQLLERCAEYLEAFRLSNQLPVLAEALALAEPAR